MTISQFPAPGISIPPTAFTATLPVALRTYRSVQSFEPGIYTIQVTPSTANVRAGFISSTGFIGSTNTTSGAVIYNLASAATGVNLMALSGAPSNTQVTINRTASPLTSSDVGNGTLDTINTTSTYNTTGILAVLVYSGGAQGESAGPDLTYSNGGAGGRAGFINGDVVVTNTPTTVTIGAGGIGSINAPVNPTNSSFGNLVVADQASTAYPNGNGGWGNGVWNDGNGAVAGNASAAFLSWNGNQTTGGGGGANTGDRGAGVVRVGGGSGIGTGGSSPAFNTDPAGNGTGKASGGGGGKGGPSNVGRKGGNGAPGVVYVLRGF